MIIEGNSVAECWLSLLKAIINSNNKELSPVIVTIHQTNIQPNYVSNLESDINEFLDEIREPHIETTASTIFPSSLIGGNSSIFERYEKIWVQIKRNTKNRRGTYFRRLSAYGSGTNTYGVNQLQHIIDTYNGTGTRKPIHRRSALIAITFDPSQDHKSTPMLGFPCLQQVCFIPEPKSKTLSINAIYAMQYLDARAYGNYIGLIRLGNFMAKQMGLTFTHINCMLSVVHLSKMTRLKAQQLIKKYPLKDNEK